MNVFIIKLIALTAMIIDHMGYTMQRSGISGISVTLRHVGRLAFPLYAFLIGVGCMHTKDIKKYLTRLLMFAFISEIPFNLFKNIGKYGDSLPLLDSTGQNVFFTLFLGAMALTVYFYWSKPADPRMRALAGIGAAFVFATVAEFMHTDYGAEGVMLIAIPAILADLTAKDILKKPVQILFMGYLLYLINVKNPVSYFFAALSSLILVFLYNGKKGKSLKWLFYAVYPVHLALFYLIWRLFIYSAV